MADQAARPADPTPRLGDPVVVAGIKYRIRHFGTDAADCRTSFGNQWARVSLAGLTWDARAGVFRTPEAWVPVHNPDRAGS